MRVRFRVNLGSNDARPLKLSFQHCRKGMELEVPEEAGQWLVSKGHAVEVVPIKAVAQKPAITAPLSSMVKHKEKLPSHKEG